MRTVFPCLEGKSATRDTTSLRDISVNPNKLVTVLILRGGAILVTSACSCQMDLSKLLIERRTYSNSLRVSILHQIKLNKNFSSLSTFSRSLFMETLFRISLWPLLFPKNLLLKNGPQKMPYLAHIHNLFRMKKLLNSTKRKSRLRAKKQG